jgi:hypothetical protein
LDVARCAGSNSIVWGNLPDQIAGNSGTVTTMTHTCVEDGFAGEGNIDADPLFVAGSSGTWTAAAVYDADTGQTTFADSAAGLDPNELAGKFLRPNISLDPSDPRRVLQSLIVSNTATTVTVWGDFASIGANGANYLIYDYHLSPGSPCIDAGDNTAVPAGITTDLGGNLRFIDDPFTPDTGLGPPPVVDMGAYEYLPGDLDGDGDVDLTDYDVWAKCLNGPDVNTPPEGCTPMEFELADLRADNDVDLEDFAAFELMMNR